jgi:hypothetical protein
MDRNPLTPSDPDDRDSSHKARRSPRMTIAGNANLRAQTLYNVEVRVKNVSTCGFMAECSAPVQIGSYVTLDVPGIGPVHAQVRWQIGFTMGGMFLDPISLARCEWTAVKAEPIPAE